MVVRNAAAVRKRALKLSDMESQHDWFFKLKFDQYDRINSKQATKFLLNSLETDTKDVLLYKVGFEPEDFGIVLFALLDDVRPHTSQAVRSLVTTVLNADPRDNKLFPQQNIQMFCNYLRPKIKELETGNFWDSMNNPELCRILSLAGDGEKDNKEYSNPLVTMLEGLGFFFPADAPTKKERSIGIREAFPLISILSLG